MKKALIVLAIVALSNSAWGQGVPIGGARDKYKTFISVCSLTEDQLKQLDDIDAAHTRDVKDFMTANKDRIAAIQQAIKKALDDGDANALTTAQAELNELADPLLKKGHEYYASVEAILTPVQKPIWQEHKAVELTKAVLTPVTLSKEQVDKVRSTYEGLVKTKSSLDDIMPALIAEVKANILTDAQKKVANKAKKPGPWGSKVF